MSGSGHKADESKFAALLAQLDELRNYARRQRQRAALQRNRAAAARAVFASSMASSSTAPDSLSAEGRSAQAAPAAALVAFAASAGGLPPLMATLDALPRDFQAAVVVAFHTGAGSTLPELLQKRCGLPVKFGENGEQISSGVVYVAPPRQHLIVNANRTFSLSNRERLRFASPSGDWLFHSVAASYASSAVAVVLSGYQSDGSHGIVSILRAGGMTIVQDPDTCEVKDMPAAAIASGAASRIVPPELIANTIIQRLQELDLDRFTREFDHPFAAAV
jgi:two-component system chemotaxis response regulator CheB